MNLQSHEYMKPFTVFELFDVSEMIDKLGQRKWKESSRVEEVVMGRNKRQENMMKNTLRVVIDN